MGSLKRQLASPQRKKTYNPILHAQIYSTRSHKIGFRGRAPRTPHLIIISAKVDRYHQTDRVWQYKVQLSLLLIFDFRLLKKKKKPGSSWARVATNRSIKMDFYPIIMWGSPMDQNFFFAVVGYLLLIGAMGFVRPSHDFQSGLGRPGPTGLMFRLISPSPYSMDGYCNTKKRIPTTHWIKHQGWTNTRKNIHSLYDNNWSKKDQM